MDILFDIVNLMSPITEWSFQRLNSHNRMRRKEDNHVKVNRFSTKWPVRLWSLSKWSLVQSEKLNRIDGTHIKTHSLTTSLTLQRAYSNLIGRYMLRIMDGDLNLNVGVLFIRYGKTEGTSIVTSSGKEKQGDRGEGQWKFMLRYPRIIEVGLGKCYIRITSFNDPIWSNWPCWFTLKQYMLK